MDLLTATAAPGGEPPRAQSRRIDRRPPSAPEGAPRPPPEEEALPPSAAPTRSGNAGRMEKGTRVPVDLKVGDSVIYGKYSGTPFQVGDEEVIIIKASDVLAKIS